MYLHNNIKCKYIYVNTLLYTILLYYMLTKLVVHNQFLGIRLGI